MKLKTLIYVCLFAVTAMPSMAVDLVGSLTQGGLVKGQVPIGTEISLDGRSVKVGAKGHFVMGFSRDAAPSPVLLSFTGSYWAAAVENGGIGRTGIPGRPF